MTSSDAVTDFNRDGFAVVRSFLPIARAIELRGLLVDQLDPTEDPPPSQRFVPRIVERDDRFAAIATDEALVSLITRIFGVVPHLICTYGHEKPPGTPAHTAPHSDVAHLSGVPHSRSLLMVKVVVALTTVSPDGGPTLVYPGSHRGEAPGRPAAVELGIGDLLVFHANLRHTATANLSTAARLGIWLTFGQPWLRSFPGFAFSPEFLERWQPALAARPELRHLFGLADPYATGA